MYLVCNLAVGGMGGDPSGTAWPTQYLVDYIRAWEHVAGLGQDSHALTTESVPL
jgi:hypothetical protein